MERYVSSCCVMIFKNLNARSKRDMFADVIVGVSK